MDGQVAVADRFGGSGALDERPPILDAACADQEPKGLHRSSTSAVPGRLVTTDGHGVGPTKTEPPMEVPARWDPVWTPPSRVKPELLDGDLDQAVDRRRATDTLSSPARVSITNLSSGEVCLRDPHRGRKAGHVDRSAVAVAVIVSTPAVPDLDRVGDAVGEVAAAG